MLFLFSPGGLVLLFFRLLPSEAFILLYFSFEFPSFRLIAFSIFLSDYQLYLGLRRVLIFGRIRCLDVMHVY